MNVVVISQKKQKQQLNTYSFDFVVPQEIIPNTNMVILLLSLFIISMIILHLFL